MTQLAPECGAGRQRVFAYAALPLAAFSQRYAQLDNRVAVTGMAGRFRRVAAPAASIDASSAGPQSLRYKYERELRRPM